jgi:hypothetical protein
MFFEIFWTAYIPIAIVILSLIGDWLKQSFRRLLANARRAPASRRRIRLSNDWRNGQLRPADAPAYGTYWRLISSDGVVCRGRVH